MKITLSDKVYDTLKWLGLIVLPAVAVLYSSLAATWGFPMGPQVSETANALCAFIGAVVGVSSMSYNKSTL